MRDTLPRTAAAVRAWNGEGLPPEDAFAAIADELAQAQEGQSIGQLSRRLNFEQPGMRALLLKTARAKADLSPPYKDALIALDPRWGETDAVAVSCGATPTRSRRCSCCARWTSR